MVNVPTMDIVRRGILIGFVAKLGSGSSGVSMKKETKWEFGITNNNY
jgi:hypothetical protein